LKRVADLLFTKTVRLPERPEVVGKFYEKPSVEFLLLVIDKRKVRARMYFVKGKYYHIYGSIPKEAYKIKKVKRDKKGRFYF